MKILAASDLHSDKKAAQKLADKAKKNKVELVVLCGDIVEVGMSDEGLIGPFKKAGIEVLMVHGNHDNPAELNFLSDRYGKGVYNLHSYYKVFGNVAVLGAGGTNFGFFGTDDDLIKTLKSNFKKVKGKKTILLTHEPPLNTKLDNLGWTNAGNGDIRNIIEKYKPDLVFCGHIHETFGLADYVGKTKVINAGKKGIIVDI